MLAVLAAAPLVSAFAPLSAAPNSRASVGFYAGAVLAPATSIRTLPRKSRHGLRMEVDEGSATLTSAALETLKGDLMTQLSVGTGLKGAADPSNRAEINELVLKLEPMNPTESAATSPLLNGVWELLYTGG